MTPEPLDGLPGVPTGEVHHQIDGTPATMTILPVEELGAGDRKRAAVSVPPRFVSPITHRVPIAQNDFQRDFSNQVGPVSEVVGPEVVSRHGRSLFIFIFRRRLRLD
jgi:hypothetical protein